MFWTLLRKILWAGGGRLGLALLALTSGGAVTFALLNLQVDAERKWTQEFRRFGANVLITPGRAERGADPGTPLFEETRLRPIASANMPGVIASAPFLYVVARDERGRAVIVAGTRPEELRALTPWWKVEGAWIGERGDRDHCLLGRNVARSLAAGVGSRIVLLSGIRRADLTVAGLIEAGGSEDNQIFVSLEVAQDLAEQPGRIGLVQLSVRGTPAEIESVTAGLAGLLPGLEVRPIRQLAEAEGRILGRIRLLIVVMVTLILALTGLSVLSTMISVALERRQDVGLMMALGGRAPHVVRLFLTEVTLLGAAGGLLGSFAGIFLTAWIGRGIFSTPISSRPEVLLLTVAVMVTVALAGSLPLRLLGRVRPAVILRGD